MFPDMILEMIGSFLGSIEKLFSDFWIGLKKNGKTVILIPSAKVHTYFPTEKSLPVVETVSPNNPITETFTKKFGHQSHQTVLSLKRN